MTRFILVDGQPAGAVSALDRGLQFGDGVFETMAVIGGKVRLLPLHMTRLQKGAAVLRIALPAPERLSVELQDAARQLGHGILKLIVTRGSGQRGYAPPRHARPRRIVYASDWPALPDAVVLRVCSTRLATGGSLAAIKHLNRLEQVLARLEWDDDERAHDGLMLDSQDNVIETTRANLFVVNDTHLVTPRLAECGVAGVMREVVLELAGSAGLHVSESTLSLDDVRAADEVFTTNAIAGITPVVALETTAWRRGPVTARLQQAFDAACGGA